MSRGGEQPTRVSPAVRPRTPRRGPARRGAARGANRRVSVAQHPRIARYVRAAKAWGGLVAFALVAWASSSAGAEPFDVLLRALAAGIAGWMIVWAAAVQIGRSMVSAEVAAHRKLRDEADEKAAAAALDGFDD